MNIVHVSTHDTLGGAAMAAHRLHSALKRKGVGSRMQVAWRRSDDEAVSEMATLTGSARWWRVLRRMRAHGPLKLTRRVRPPDADLFSAARTQFGRDLLRAMPPCDVIHLHWVAELVDYGAFLPLAAAAAPLVWTLHDMNPFTGGCHYSGGCERFTERCGACPQLASRREGDLSRRIWRRKFDALSRVGAGRLRIVAPSQWMADLARRSSLLGGFDVTVIPNGVDTSVFAPLDRSAARRRLAIADDARVVLFVAHHLNDRRKGAALLMDALGRLSQAGAPTLLTVGQGECRPPRGVAHCHVAPVTDEAEMVRLYAAADVLAVPSAQDNLPNTIIEAMACGLPLVAFSVGGVADAVESGQTGLLVEGCDADRFAEALERLLGDDGLRGQMSAASRRQAMETFSLDVVAGRYLDLYEGMIR